MNVAVRFPGKNIPREVVEAVWRSANLGVEICDQGNVRLYSLKQSFISLEEGKPYAEKFCAKLGESYELFPEFWVRENRDAEFIPAVDYAIQLEQKLQAGRRGPDLLASHRKHVGP